MLLPSGERGVLQGELPYLHNMFSCNCSTQLHHKTTGVWLGPKPGCVYEDRWWPRFGPWAAVCVVEMPAHLYPFSVLPYLHGQGAYCVLCNQTDAFGW